MRVSLGRAELTFDGAIGVTRLAGQVALGKSDIDLADLSIEMEDRHIFVIALEDPMTRSSELCSSLARKFRDTVFYHLFADWTPKRIELDVLCLLPGIDGPLAASLQDELRRRIPLSHADWTVESAAGVYVLTEAMWRKKFGPESIEIADAR